MILMTVNQLLKLSKNQQPHSLLLLSENLSRCLICLSLILDLLSLILKRQLLNCLVLMRIFKSSITLWTRWLLKNSKKRKELKCNKWALKWMQECSWQEIQWWEIRWWILCMGTRWWVIQWWGVILWWVTRWWIQWWATQWWDKTLWWATQWWEETQCLTHKEVCLNNQHLVLLMLQYFEQECRWVEIQWTAQDQGLSLQDQIHMTNQKLLKTQSKKNLEMFSRLQKKNWKIEFNTVNQRLTNMSQITDNQTQTYQNKTWLNLKHKIHLM